jgi:hypothetical protein
VTTPGHACWPRSSHVASSRWKLWTRSRAVLARRSALPPRLTRLRSYLSLGNDEATGIVHLMLVVASHAGNPGASSIHRRSADDPRPESQEAEELAQQGLRMQGTRYEIENDQGFCPGRFPVIATCTRCDRSGCERHLAGGHRTVHDGRVGKRLSVREIELLARLLRGPPLRDMIDSGSWSGRWSECRRAGGRQACNPSNGRPDLERAT